MPNPRPPRGPQGLDSVVDSLINTSIAPSTRQSYSSGLNACVKFLLLCNIVSRVHLPSIPISQELLMYFAAYCFDRPLSQ